MRSFALELEDLSKEQQIWQFFDAKSYLNLGPKPAKVFFGIVLQ